MASLGSTMFSITWKARHTPSGRLIPAQRARAVPTSASGSIGQLGWPTTAARDWKSGAASQETLDGNARPLTEIAALCAVHPGSCVEGLASNGVVLKGSGTDYFAASAIPGFIDLATTLAGWNTARATDGSNGGPNQANGALSADVALCGWDQPTAHGQEPIGYLLGPNGWEIVPASGQLNAEFSLWLIGVPDEFSRCVLLATQLYSRRRKRGSKR